VAGSTTLNLVDRGQRGRAMLNGRELAYCQYGNSGPVIVLIHGVGSSGECWQGVAPLLAQGGAQVIAVDLPGHGQSNKERGDYSLGAMASAMRDLLDYLGHTQAIFVGHSLGGGIALQFLYQYPQYLTGLVLVSSGGLGSETGAWLRAISLPGAGVVLGGFARPKVLKTTAWLGRRLRSMGFEADYLSEEMLEGIGVVFTDRDSRRAFLATLRSVVDGKGQTASALVHLPKAVGMPVLLLWGGLDPMIPVSHGENAAALLPHSRLVVFDSAGHDPHLADPARFVDLVLNHVRTCV